MATGRQWQSQRRRGLDVGRKVTSSDEEIKEKALGEDKQCSFSLFFYFFNLFSLSFLRTKKEEIDLGF